jgi:hypothetical protein
MGLKVTNNAFGTLNAGINSSVTTLVLAAGQGSLFPTLTAGDYFYATLIDTSNNLEIVKVTARSTDTMTIVRGQDNTTARAYSTNDRFELRPTAILFNEKANANEYLPLAGGTMTGKLAVGTGTTAAAALHAQSSGSEADRSLRLAYDATYYAVLAQGGAGGLYYRTFGGMAHVWEQAGTEVKRIDGSGRVTIPNQPFFYAQLTVDRTGLNLASTGDVVVVYNDLVQNTGSNYSTSTGKFTAPVAGVYAFFAAAYSAVQVFSQSWLVINGSRGNSTDWHFGANTNFTVGHWIVKLSANDTVGFHPYNGGVTSGTVTGNTTHSYFRGYLLG